MHFYRISNSPNLASVDSSDQYLPCVHCVGDRCWQIENVTTAHHCESHPGQCYTALLRGKVFRGCVGDEFYEKMHKSIKREDMKLCNNDRFCNQDTIVDACIHCDSETDEKCKNPTLGMVQACSLKSTRGKGCYLKKLSEKSYERGCLEDLAQVEQLKCKDPESTECQSCMDTNCNQKSVLNQKCFYCNGTIDSDCAEAKNQKVEITCLGYSSSCLVGVDNDGYAHRQCSTNEDEDKLRFPKGFNLCYGNLCNNQIPLKDWTKCYRCAGSASGCDNPGLHVPEVCRLYQDSCFFYDKDRNFYLTIDKMVFNVLTFCIAFI